MPTHRTSRPDPEVTASPSPISNIWGTSPIYFDATPVPEPPVINAYCNTCYNHHGPVAEMQRNTAGGWICASCVRRITTRCTRCTFLLASGDSLYSTDLDDVDECCSSCVETLELTVCNNCDVASSSTQRVRFDDSRLLFCEDCRDSVEYCNDCGNYGECQCQDARLHEYNWKPVPIFMKSPKDVSDKGKYTESGLLYLGFELEVERNNVDDARSLAIIEEIGGKLLYCKRDGSLNSGFEVVSHPMTWNALQDTRHEFAEMFRRLAALGLRSYNTETCGLHVHHSRDQYTRLQLLKVQELVCGYSSFTLKVSQRQRERLDEYASLTAEQPHTFVQKAREGRNTRHDHYSRRVAVNLENPETVEYRLFRGTLRPSGFFKALEYTVALYHYTRNASLDDCTEQAFRAWVQHHRRAFPCLSYFLTNNVNLSEEAFNQLGRDPRVTSPIQELVAA
jgi:hypothetical protein